MLRHAGCVTPYDEALHSNSDKQDGRACMAAPDIVPYCTVVAMQAGSPWPPPAGCRHPQMIPGQSRHLSAQGTHFMGAVISVARKMGDTHQASHNTHE